jgi:hypothetical protein
MASGGVTIDISGVKEFGDAVNANIDALSYALGRALWTAAHLIGDDSQELIPIDDGNLKGSIRYVPDNEAQAASGTTPEISINYTAPYALYQHEKLDLYHPSRARGGAGPTAPGTPGGSPKYLEFPFLAETSNYPEGLVRLVRAKYNAIESRGRG